MCALLLSRRGVFSYAVGKNNYTRGKSFIGLLVDPPLYALSWNLKNSHVFSGSF